MIPIIAFEKEVEEAGKDFLTRSFDTGSKLQHVLTQNKIKKLRELKSN